MVFDRNTRVSVRRGATTDDYGDPVDTMTMVAYRVPASVRSTTYRESSPDQGRVFLAVFWRVRLPYGTDVRIGDRLYTDEGQTLVVEYIADDEPSWGTGFGIRVEARAD